MSAFEGTHLIGLHKQLIEYGPEGIPFWKHVASLVSLALCTLATFSVAPLLAQEKVSAGETHQIAEEAFIYGLPLVMELHGVLQILHR